jgi:hypothetical protein
VVSVEAARHAIGRIADITADKHMEGVRLTRWLLSPVPTFRLSRRMKLWELRSYEQVIKLEQERLVYQARLRSRFGRAWRRKAPVESLMPLRLARYGVPLAETAPSGLAAAGIEPAVLPAAPRISAPMVENRATMASPASPQGQQGQYGQQAGPPEESPWLHARHPQQIEYHGDYDPMYEPEQYSEQYQEQYPEQYFEPEQHPEQFPEQYSQRFPVEEEPPYEEMPGEETGSFPIPVSPGRTRELGEGGGNPEPDEESYYQVFKQSINGSYPTPREFSDNAEATFGVPVPDAEAKRLVLRFQNRHAAELEDDHIA